ncbi:uncharacterized protein PF11_0207-like [Photinus pyralis]|uniref:uncharacterized protein PF11_0207-like n=1 Tax=Photinus pyralis TaxID=7054 RepID=UPI00126749A0|nr:uncharacterized protein PF11_0207-like [Photinus pyralis]
MELRSGFKKPTRDLPTTKADDNNMSKDGIEEFEFSPEGQDVLEAVDTPTPNIDMTMLSQIMQTLQTIQTGQGTLRQEVKTGQGEAKMSQEALRQEVKKGQEAIEKKIEDKVEQIERRLNKKQEEAMTRCNEEIRRQREDSRQHIQVQETRVRKLEDDTDSIRRQTAHAINSIDGKLIQNTENIKGCERRITHTEEAISRMEEKITGEGLGSSSVKRTTIINRAEALLGQKPRKFDGNIRNVHPVNFIKSMESYWINLNLADENKLILANDYLEGNAKAWADLYGAN